MSVKCKLLGHKMKPYRWSWVEFTPRNTDKSHPYNREGAYVISHVYCIRCGELRVVVNQNDRIKYTQI